MIKHKNLKFERENVNDGRILSAHFVNVFWAFYLFWLFYKVQKPKILFINVNKLSLQENSSVVSKEYFRKANFRQNS